MIRYNEDDTLTDGIYDDLAVEVRQKYVQGKLTHTITKLWIESTNPHDLNRLEDWMKLAWQTYPNLPPKQKRK